MLPLDELERAAGAAGCLTVRDEPMNRHTTFRIGGPADLFVTVCSEEGMQLLLRKPAGFMYRCLCWEKAPICWFPIAACADV